MFWRIGVPVLAAFALGTAAATTIRLTPGDGVTPPVHEPPASPATGDWVAGLGVVEPPGQRVAVGTGLPGVVTRVAVVAGQTVAAGDALFALDDREMKAERAVRAEALAVEEARLARAVAGFRPEDEPPARHRVEAARAASERTGELLRRAERLASARVAPREELDTRRGEARAAQAELAVAEAELARLLAGTWEKDLAVARAVVAQARAHLRRVEADLARLVVRAPGAGVVLQVNVRAGEYAAAGRLDEPLVVLGPAGPPHVRVQVDEVDADRVVAGRPAEGLVRGPARRKVPLRFVRLEPYLVPKKSLTGSPGERVDTRVLQVVYEVSPGAGPVYAGQVLDVFIRADGDD